VRRTSASSAAARRRFGAAFFDALDLAVGHPCALGEFGDGEAEDGADVVHGLAEGQRFADRNPLGVIGGLCGPCSAGVVSGHHHTCLS